MAILLKNLRQKYNALDFALASAIPENDNEKEHVENLMEEILEILNSLEKLETLNTFIF